LDNQIRTVAGELHKAAVEDALLHARRIFTLDAEGNAVQLDSNGIPVAGKDGVNPFSPGEWMEQQKELRPHWFPNGTSGSGVAGVREAGAGFGKTVTRAVFEKLSGTDKQNILKNGIKIV